MHFDVEARPSTHRASVKNRCASPVSCHASKIIACSVISLSSTQGTTSAPMASYSSVDSYSSANLLRSCWSEMYDARPSQRQTGYTCAKFSPNYCHFGSFDQTWSSSIRKATPPSSRTRSILSLRTKWFAGDASTSSDSLSSNPL